MQLSSSMKKHVGNSKRSASASHHGTKVMSLVSHPAIGTEGCTRVTWSIFQLKPSFRAVAVVLNTKDYQVDPTMTAHTPVCLVRTGVEGYLSAPISFDSIAGNGTIEYHTGRDGETRELIRTTLQIAVEFIMGLDRREVAAFGIHPDPWALRSGWGKWEEPLIDHARRVGWKGNITFKGPSSAWVDMDLYLDWIGVGAYQHRVRNVQILEEHERLWALRALSKRRFLIRHY